MTTNPQQPEEQPEIDTTSPEYFESLVTYFASTNFRNELRRFGIKGDDRRRHMYVIGKTGMGKSTMLENMIIQDIRNGNGLSVVDPHGDLVEKIINFIPNDRINDVIYFNPADVDHPIAFNILENVELEYKNLVSNGLVGVFKKIWADSWGPRLEYILINAILALIEYPGSTLLGVTRMLVDAKYRKKVVKNISDPVVRSFWVDEYNNYSEKFRNEAIAPIQNKVGQFLSSSLIRNIVGQPKSTINMRDIMDNRKILLMNLSKGRIGEENSALLGAMMITKIQLAAMSRVDILEQERKDFFLYVDEFQNFSTEAFANILSEARKYRLNIIMAHQYIEQLSDEVRAAVFGNVGTMVTFRVGATDAEELEKEYAPLFTQEDLVVLPSYHVYLRLMIDGVASDPFSATTLPPLEGATENREKVIQVSRERYAKERAAVEEMIMRWSGHLREDEDKDSDDEPEEKRPGRDDAQRRQQGGKQGGKPGGQRSGQRKDGQRKDGQRKDGQKREGQQREQRKGDQQKREPKPAIDLQAVPRPPTRPVMDAPPRPPAKRPAAAAEEAATTDLNDLKKKGLSFVGGQEQPPAKTEHRSERRPPKDARQKKMKPQKQQQKQQQGQQVTPDYSSLSEALGEAPWKQERQPRSQGKSPSGTQPSSRRRKRRKKKKPTSNTTAQS